MSQRKSERIMNLLIALLGARTPLTRDRIRSFNEGYHGLGDEAFEQAFERDKKELRGLGITIRTREVDLDAGAETGYYVDRSEFELPALDFSAEERAMLGAAAHVWQESVAAEETAQALMGLRSAGVATDASRLMTLRPQLRADPRLHVVHAALGERRELRFDYRGEPRRVHPWQLSMRRGQWYLLAMDLDRSEPRRFKLQRFTSDPVARGRAGAYEVPDELPAGEEAVVQTALVALHDDVPSELRRSARPATADGDLPEGFTAFEVPAENLHLLASEVCALGDGAIALAPEELRTRVVDQLQGVASR